MNEKFLIAKAWKSSFPVGSELLAFNHLEPHHMVKTALAFSPIEAYTSIAQEELSSYVLSGLINLQSPMKTPTVSYVYKGDTVMKELKSPRLRKVLNSPEFLGDNAQITYQHYDKKAVLCITSFSPASIGSFKKRLDELFKKIKADSIESLAIDLRNNTGGYILLQEYLMSFLTPEGTKYSNHYVYKRSDYDRFEQLSKVQKWRFKNVHVPNGEDQTKVSPSHFLPLTRMLSSVSSIYVKKNMFVISFLTSINKKFLKVFLNAFLSILIFQND